MVIRFQKASKTKDESDIIKLIAKAKSLAGNELSENLFPLSIEYEDCITEIINNDNNTDAAFIVAFSLISHIEKYASGKYEIIHDKSRNLLRYNKFLNWFSTVDEDLTFKQTSITTIKFPLLFTSVSQVDSCDSYGVQLADILIGGAMEHAMASVGHVAQNDYNQSVIELYGENNFIHMLPSLDFEECKQQRLGTQAKDLIEFVANNFR